jgi:hypothetical protein
MSTDALQNGAADAAHVLPLSRKRKRASQVLDSTTPECHATLTAAADVITAELKLQRKADYNKEWFAKKRARMTAEEHEQQQAVKRASAAARRMKRVQQAKNGSPEEMEQAVKQLAMKRERDREYEARRRARWTQEEHEANKARQRERAAERRAKRTVEEHELKKASDRARAAAFTDEQKNVRKQRMKQWHVDHRDEIRAANREAYSRLSQEEKLKLHERDAKNQAAAAAAIDTLKNTQLGGRCCHPDCPEPGWNCEIDHRWPKGNAELGIAGKLRGFASCKSTKAVREEVQRNTQSEGEGKGAIHLDLRCVEHHRDRTFQRKRVKALHATNQQKLDVINAWKIKHSTGCNGGCWQCGKRISNEHPPFHFDADHLDPTIKTIAVGRMVNAPCTMSDVMAELAKCRLMCCNCHRAWTHVQRNWRHASKAKEYLEIKRSQRSIAAVNADGPQRTLPNTCQTQDLQSCDQPIGPVDDMELKDVHTQNLQRGSVTSDEQLI